MEEQKDLDDLKKLMAEQQAKPASTMAEMEIKATTLQEKLDKKPELFKSNAKAGVKKVALEYKVVELDLNIKPPNGFKFGEPDEKTTAFPTNKRGFNSAQVKNAFGNASKGGGIQFSAFGQPDPTSKEFEDQAVTQDMKNEAKKRFSLRTRHSKNLEKMAGHFEALLEAVMTSQTRSCCITSRDLSKQLL